jgi:myo-inositol-1-phosphate synthase
MPSGRNKAAADRLPEVQSWRAGRESSAMLKGRHGSQKTSCRLVGVGNCASSFVQGLTHYAEATANAPPPGLMHVELGGYHVSDIEIASAFDIHAGKVGRDVAEAIVVAPNNTMRFANAPAHRRDGSARAHTGRRSANTCATTSRNPTRRWWTWRRNCGGGHRVLVSYLPVGSQAATEFYAEQALAAGCAFVNCIPVFIASNPTWARRFERARACRSSATTSRARSAPPSSTACWPTCSASAACGSTAPTS